MIESIKPGQKIRCTIRHDMKPGKAVETIMRLMRRDPDIRRGLSAAQQRRMKRLNVRSRGGRPWAVREKAAKIAQARRGESWTMPWVPHIAPDLRSVERHLEIEAI